MRRAMKWAKDMAVRPKVAACARAMILWTAAMSGGSGLQAQVLLQGASTYDNRSIGVGAERTAQYLPLLQRRRVAVVTNATGMIGSVHLVDSLLALRVNVVKVFAPEHGFRGTADAGEQVQDERDVRTGLPIVSLYGANKGPTSRQLADVDVLLFDIQDVGVRFYTYIGTLHYVMVSAARNNKPLVVLDRPNPNGYYVDGPVLDTAYRSFVGMHPVPLVHGMTIGEFARMINGEGWLGGGLRCELTVVECVGYDHTKFYELPVRPSPNLPNMSAVYLYPSLGLFEGTPVSVGRGTDKPFQCIGWPQGTSGSFRFTPRIMPGAKDPPHLGKECRGFDLSEFGTFYLRLTRQIYLHWLIGMYQAAPDKSTFFTPFFDKLAGGPALRQAIEAGLDEEHIRASWKPALDDFMKIRAKYLLYDDR
jgi:uncharacterized protein YbbC (DUF1343 family)